MKSKSEELSDSQAGGHSHGGHSHGGHHAHGVKTELGFVTDESLALRGDRAPGFAQGQVIFLDPQSGIAGDMFVASFLDLGIPFSAVIEALASIPLDGYEMSARRGYSGVIATTHFSVRENQKQSQRTYAQIREILLNSSLAKGIKDRALEIFMTLGRAEAEVHGMPLEDVSFHEVGAIDSIVDIVAAAACIEYAGAKLLVGPVQVGKGWVDCQHGRLPLPAPATLNCLKGIQLISSGLEAELVTPTGAAILGSQAKGCSVMPSMTLQGVAYGAGTRGLADRPNALRLLLGSIEASTKPDGEKTSELSSRPLVRLSANIDDMSGESLGFAMAELTASPALDVWLSPITMKKGRPAVELSLLVLPDMAEEFARLMMSLTTTLGVRQTLIERYELARESIDIATQWGDVSVKRSELGSVKPEYEDCARIAREYEVPLASVIAEVLRVYQGI